MTNLNDKSYIVSTKEGDIVVNKNDNISYLNIFLSGINFEDYAKFLAQSTVNLMDMLNTLIKSDELNEQTLQHDTDLLNRMYIDIYGDETTTGLYNHVLNILESIKNTNYQLDLNNNSIVMLYTRTKEIRININELTEDIKRLTAMMMTNVSNINSIDYTNQKQMATLEALLNRINKNEIQSKLNKETSSNVGNLADDIRALNDELQLQQDRLESRIIELRELALQNKEGIDSNTTELIETSALIDESNTQLLNINASIQDTQNELNIINENVTELGNRINIIEGNLTTINNVTTLNIDNIEYISNETEACNQNLESSRTQILTVHDIVHDLDNTISEYNEICKAFCNVNGITIGAGSGGGNRYFKFKDVDVKVICYMTLTFHPFSTTDRSNILNASILFDDNSEVQLTSEQIDRMYSPDTNEGIILKYVPEGRKFLGISINFNLTNESIYIMISNPINFFIDNLIASSVV